MAARHTDVGAEVVDVLGLLRRGGEPSVEELVGVSAGEEELLARAAGQQREAGPLPAYGLPHWVAWKRKGWLGEWGRGSDMYEG